MAPDGHSMPADDVRPLLHTGTVTDLKPWWIFVRAVKNFKASPITNSTPDTDMDVSSITEDQRSSNGGATADAAKERPIDDPRDNTPIEVCYAVTQPEYVYDRPPKPMEPLYLL